jgi:hypothetical protein
VNEGIDKSVYQTVRGGRRRRGDSEWRRESDVGIDSERRTGGAGTSSAHCVVSLARSVTISEKSVREEGGGWRSTEGEAMSYEGEPQSVESPRVWILVVEPERNDEVDA